MIYMCPAYWRDLKLDLQVEMIFEEHPDKNCRDVMKKS